MTMQVIVKRYQRDENCIKILHVYMSVFVITNLSEYLQLAKLIMEREKRRA
jgi:phage shock protein PspC (stress-responsive transcriptional regulator)